MSNEEPSDAVTVSRIRNSYQSNGKLSVSRQLLPGSELLARSHQKEQIGLG